MTTSSSLMSLPTELILEIASYLPFYDLYALHLTNRHCHRMLPAVETPPVNYDPYQPPYQKKYPRTWDDDEILAIEESTWAKDNNLLHCDYHDDLKDKAFFAGKFTPIVAGRMTLRRGSAGWDISKARQCDWCTRNFLDDEPDEEMFWCWMCCELLHSLEFTVQRPEDLRIFCIGCMTGTKEPEPEWRSRTSGWSKEIQG